MSERYHKAHVLGAGGFGVVWLAHDTKLGGRAVVIKELRKSPQNDGAWLARFRREATVLIQLAHPNIVKLYDLDESVDGTIGLVLEYVDGGTLAEIIRDERNRGQHQSPRAAAATVVKLADAVAYAHGYRRVGDENADTAGGIGLGATALVDDQSGRTHGQKLLAASDREDSSHGSEQARHHGYLHRDLKPANILVTSDGTPKISDFGLAHRIVNDSLAHSGEILGTPRYLAPEQAEGLTGRLGPWTDVYGLGTILYELLTGEPIYPAVEGETVLTAVARVIYEEIREPRKLRPEVPADLEAICLKCLDKSRHRRYQSADDLADDLRRYLDNRPTRARPLGPTGRLVRLCARHPVDTVLVLLGIVALLAVFTSWQWRQTEAARKEVVSAADSLREERDRTEAARKVVARLNYRLVLDGGMSKLKDGDAPHGALLIARSLMMSAALEQDAGQRPIRSALAMAYANLHRLEQVLDYPGLIRVAVPSIDGTALALAGNDGHVRLLSVSDGHQLWDYACGSRREDSVAAGAFTPDGRLFVAATDGDNSNGGTVHVIDAATGHADGGLIRHNGRPKAIALAPDGDTLLVVGHDGRKQGKAALRLYRLTTRDPLSKGLEYPYNLNTAAFDPKGRWVATGGDDKVVRFWDAKTLEPIGHPLPHTDTVFCLAVSHDSKLLATGCLDYRARVWALDLEEPSQLQNLLHRSPVRGVAFSKEDDLLLSGTEDGTAQLWEATTGKPVGHALTHGGEVRQVCFLPDQGHALTASHDGSARLWRLALRPSLALTLDHPAPVLAATFSPDGTKVLTGCHSADGRPGAARLWDADTGRLLLDPLPQEGQVLAVAFSPDGRLALSAGNDRSVRLWEVSTGRLLHRYTHPSVIMTATFSHDGATLAFAGDRKTVRLKGVRAAKEDLGEWDTGVDAWVWHLEFDPIDRNLLTVGGRLAQLWDLSVVEGRARRLKTELRHLNEIRFATFSPDGRMVLTCSLDHTAGLWSADDGRSLAALNGHSEGVTKGAFSYDGTKVATASADGTVRLWQVRTGTSWGTPLAHDGKVTALAFSPDDTLLATGCDNGTLRLWDVSSGAQLGLVLFHKGPLNTVAFRPRPQDGKGPAEPWPLTVLTASSDGFARLWQIPAPASGSAEFLEMQAQVETGLELTRVGSPPQNQTGPPRVLNAKAWQERRRQLNVMAGRQ